MEKQENTPPSDLLAASATKAVLLEEEPALDPAQAMAASLVLEDDDDAVNVKAQIAKANGRISTSSSSNGTAAPGVNDSTSSSY